MVLLHPLGVDHRFWAPVRGMLPDDFGPVVAPDLLGHGSAPLPPLGAGVEAFADAVEEAVAGYGSVHLVGVSLGGLVAQVIAARNPGLVERLVLADSVAVYPDAMQSMWRERARVVREQGVGTVLESMESMWFSAGFRAEFRDQVDVVRDQLLSTDPEGYARTCEALAVADTSSTVGSITAPVLLACGRDDAPPFRAALEWFEEHLLAGRVAWLSGGHATAYEHPREFAEVLTGFLA